MIRTRRTVQIATGRHDDAIARSRELEAIWTDLGIVHATTTEVTGDCERVLWTKHWDSVGRLASRQGMARFSVPR